MENDIQYYPMNQSQKVMLFQLKLVPTKQISNICTEVELCCKIDGEILLQAMVLGLMRAPFTSFRICENENREMVQYRSYDSHEKIKRVDLSGKSEEEIIGIYRQWSAEPFPNKQENVQLYEAKLILKPNGHWAIYSKFSHLIADAHALMTVYRYIMSIYRALSEHLPIPNPPRSPIDAYEQDFRYPGSEKEQEDLAFFDALFDTEPQFTSINGKTGRDHIPGSRKGRVLRSLRMQGDSMDLPIDRAVNDAVNAFAVEAHVSPQSVYLLALRCYLAMVNDTTDVMVNNACARRATLAQKKSGGSMVNSLALRFRFGNDVSFADGCREIYEHICGAYRHSGIDTATVLEMTNRKFGKKNTETYSTIGFSFQPYRLLKDDYPFLSRHICNGCQTLSLYITMMPFGSDTGLCVNYEYQVGWTKVESIYAFHEFMQRFLKIGTQNQSKSLSSLMAEAK